MVALKIALGIVAMVILLGCIAWFVPSSLEVSRTFAAKPDRIWALWQDPQAIRHWWGPKNYSAPVVESDLRPGGTFLLVMRSPGGTESANVGTYLEVLPRKRIVQAMSFADAAGNALPGASVPVPGRWPDAVRVTTEFSPSGDGTEVRVREDGIPLIMKVLASLGWQQQFDKIELLLRDTRAGGMASAASTQS